MKVTINGGSIDENEVKAYMDRGIEKFGNSLESMDISIDGDEVNLTYQIKQPPFERIRRITGYLTGTLDKWNDAKRSEERDRVKHTA